MVAHLMLFEIADCSHHPACHDSLESLRISGLVDQTIHQSGYMMSLGCRSAYPGSVGAFHCRDAQAVLAAGRGGTTQYNNKSVLRFADEMQGRDSQRW